MIAVIGVFKLVNITLVVFVLGFAFAAYKLTR